MGQLQNKLTFSLDTEDWVWLCEVLADMKHMGTEEFVLDSDMEHALNVLEAVGAAI